MGQPIYFDPFDPIPNPLMSCCVRARLMGRVKNCHPYLRLRSKYSGKTEIARKDDTLQRLYKLLEKSLLLDDNAIEDRQPT